MRPPSTGALAPVSLRFRVAAMAGTKASARIRRRTNCRTRTSLSPTTPGARAAVFPPTEKNRETLAFWASTGESRPQKMKDSRILCKCSLRAGTGKLLILSEINPLWQREQGNSRRSRQPLKHALAGGRPRPAICLVDWELTRPPLRLKLEREPYDSDRGDCHVERKRNQRSRVLRASSSGRALHRQTGLFLRAGGLRRNSRRKGDPHAAPDDPLVYARL